MWMGYYDASQNGVFDTLTTLGSLKCKIDVLQQIVNQISPGSVPITRSNSTNNITLPIPASQITWFDSNTGNTLTIQHALQSINIQLITTNTCHLCLLQRS
jgi:hypothetical protein